MARRIRLPRLSDPHLQRGRVGPARPHFASSVMARRRSLQGVGEGPSSMALRPREAALLKEAVAKSFANLAEVLSGAPGRMKLGTRMSLFVLYNILNSQAATDRRSRARRSPELNSLPYLRYGSPMSSRPAAMPCHWRRSLRGSTATARCRSERSRRS
jgi:hypothetical protein